MTNRFSTLCLVALGLFSIQANAQSFTNQFGNSESGPYEEGGPTALNPDVLTQSNDLVTVTSPNSVSCNAGGIHTDNSYLRRFDTSVLPAGFISKNLDMAVEQAAGAGGSQDIFVNVYSIADAAAFTFANMVLEGSSGAFSVPDQALTLISVPVVASIDPGDDLVVEVFTPDGQTAGNSFFIGSNANGQTAGSFIAAADCGITEPTDLGAIGFPNIHIIMALNGVLSGGPAPMVLSVTTQRRDPLARAKLSWTGFDGGTDRVRLIESGVAVGNTPDDGAHNINYTTVPVSHTYQVCDLEVPTECSNTVGRQFFDDEETSDELVADWPTEEALGTTAPREFTFAAAYPNPFNPEATFTFAVNADQLVQAELVDMLGRVVATLYNGNVAAGELQTVRVDGSNLPSGMYLIRIAGETFSDLQRVTLLK